MTFAQLFVTGLASTLALQLLKPYPFNLIVHFYKTADNKLLIKI